MSRASFRHVLYRFLYHTQIPQRIVYTYVMGRRTQTMSRASFRYVLYRFLYHT